MADKSDTIIFVCTANICRSPMAEQLFRHALAAEPPPLNALNVVSAGVASQPGQAASAHAVTAMQKVGLSLQGHRSRLLDQDLLDRALAVFCMTDSHRAMIEIQFDRVPKHVYLMRELIPSVSDPEIPDPFGMNLTLYEAARDSMVEAIPSLVKFVRSLTNETPA